jgi:hypothetical protein
MHLRILSDHQKLFFKKDIFERGLKRVLMHFRILPDHQKNVLKKDIFDRLDHQKLFFK